jgi:hypothetical protein
MKTKMKAAKFKLIDDLYGFVVKKKFYDETEPIHLSSSDFPIGTKVRLLDFPKFSKKFIPKNIYGKQGTIQEDRLPEQKWVPVNFDENPRPEHLEFTWKVHVNDLVKLW